MSDKRFIILDSEDALARGYEDPQDLCWKYSEWDWFDVLVDTETGTVIWKDLIDQPEDMILSRSLGDLVDLIEERCRKTQPQS